MSTKSLRAKKLCFVTIGATASFDELIRVVLSKTFLETLDAADYTDLLLQYGVGGQLVLEECRRRPSFSNDTRGIRINGFAFNKRGLGEEMRAAKGDMEGVEGVVISHAGSGSILDALRIRVPLIVVPNPALLDNHQEELADELAAQGYVVHGKLNNLEDAIRQSEALRQKQKAWPPPNSGHDTSGRGLAGVMDDEMGFVD